MSEKNPDVGEQELGPVEVARRAASSPREFAETVAKLEEERDQREADRRRQLLDSLSEEK